MRTEPYKVLVNQDKSCCCDVAPQIYGMCPFCLKLWRFNSGGSIYAALTPNSRELGEVRIMPAILVNCTCGNTTTLELLDSRLADIIATLNRKGYDTAEVKCYDSGFAITFRYGIVAKPAPLGWHLGVSKISSTEVISTTDSSDMAIHNLREWANNLQSLL